jgi:DNA helicase-2/ATP-dependent DNA helicase PcrA
VADGTPRHGRGQSDGGGGDAAARFDFCVSLRYTESDAITGEAVMADKYLGKWATRWTAIQGLTRFFNKMTEEIIDPGALMASGDPFLVQLGVAYQHYEDTLQERNRLDFAHQQKLFYNVLNDPEIAEQVQAQARYVMVDEYQDTNYI